MQRPLAARRDCGGGAGGVLLLQYRKSVVLLQVDGGVRGGRDGNSGNESRRGATDREVELMMRALQGGRKRYYTEIR